MSRPLNRIVPKAPTRLFKTYGMRIVEREPVSCEVVECVPYLNGWITTVLPSSEDERTIIAACNGEIDGIRRMYAQRMFTGDGFMRYEFDAGQPCFRASTHSIPVTARYTLRDGDWRGNPTGREISTPNAQTWLDDFGEHQQRIVDQRRALGAE